MSSIPLINIFFVKPVEHDLSNTVYLAGVVCMLLRQSENLLSVYPKESGCKSPAIKQKNKKNSYTYVMHTYPIVDLWQIGHVD